MKFTNRVLFPAVCLVVLVFACKKKSTETPPVSVCDGKTIVLSSKILPASSCTSNGSITIRATGSSGFTFQLNNGAFQSDSVFSNLASGTYSVTAKDKDGCTKTLGNIVVNENSTAGPTFAPVAALIASRCEGAFCHGTGSGGAPINIMNTNCKIFNLGPTIRTKAVDEGMGSLSLNDKNKITNWINAGGRVTD